MREKSFVALRLGLLLALLAAGSGALAAQSLVVRNAWARPTVAGQQVGAAYLQITSPVDAAVVDIGSDAAAVVELHTMWMDGEVMRMRQVTRLPLPAGRKVEFAPGGMHLMLLGLKRPLHVGESLGLDLSVTEPGGARRTVHVNVPVRATAPTEGAR